MASFLLICLSTFLLTIQIYGLPNGAPKKACEGSMLPHHHKIQPQPSTTSPITKFNATWNADNETMSVHIESKKPFQGIFVQGRKMNEDKPIGKFIDIPSKMHVVDCPTGDGITHDSPQEWTKLDLTWKKPESMKTNETIQFWATVVVDFKNFWALKILLKLIFNISVSLSYYARGYILPQTVSFCHFWQYVDYTSNGCIIWCNAIFTIERYILVFYPHYLRSKRQKIILHYLPIFISNLYLIIFYIYSILIFPCENSNEYDRELCGNACIDASWSLSTFDWLFNLLLPIFVIIFGSSILLLRVIWARRKMQRNLRNWSKNWKMIVQLLGIALMYTVVWLPLSVVSLMATFTGSESLESIDENYLYYLTYLADLSIPVITFIFAPEINRRIRRGQVQPTPTCMASGKTN
ncbi:unnamed protein product [Adineta steineri]|uniref:G-protein coupled receptors family 1 profile domain-containing protein n=1 Tax=Adineta steineri TaxID=433720 RepID=A0A813PZS7_9BILA|nr:unnamed protein product [Adineta steineri]CAF0866759.1 unnamed protein product [Adineta steineri]